MHTAIAYHLLEARAASPARSRESYSPVATSSKEIALNEINKNKRRALIACERATIANDAHLLGEYRAPRRGLDVLEVISYHLISSAPRGIIASLSSRGAAVK